MTKNHEKYKEFNFKAFGNLDDNEDAEYFMDAMQELASIEGIRKMKEKAIRNLNVTQGDKVLELGCGLGLDAEIFAELVGPSGQVFAVDSSKKMLARAQKNSQHKNIEYIYGDVNSLNYPDNSFDVCYADRLLISQKNPWNVLKEAIRLLKPNGKLSITDCDFGSVVLYPYDAKISPIIMNRLQEIITNPLIGRELYHQFNLHGLKNITISPESYISQDFRQLNAHIDIPRILNDLHVLGRISDEEAKKYLSVLNNADKNKAFLYNITLFIVQGQK